MLHRLPPAAPAPTRRRQATATRVAAGLVALLVGCAVLAGCGDDDPAATPPAQSQGSQGSQSSQGGSPTPSQDGAEAPKVVDVTFEGDSVTPSGERVEVSTGQDVELHVTADAPGEIHVHSSPEQELSYDAGTSTVTIRGLTVPGTVEVESHQLDKVILQLQVR